MSDIFDALQYGAIVAHHEDYRMFVTYNGHATYNAWMEREGGEFENVDVRTIYPAYRVPGSTPVSGYEALPDEARDNGWQFLLEIVGGSDD